MSAKVLAAWAVVAAVALGALAWWLVGAGASDAAAPTQAAAARAPAQPAPIPPPGRLDGRGGRIGAAALDPDVESAPPPAPEALVVLSGQVVDELGHGVPGAVVRAWLEFRAGSQPQAEVVADLGGHFRLEWPHGRFALAAAAPGRACAQGVRGELQGALVAGGLRLLLLPEGWIQGTVVDPDERPVGGVLLELRASSEISQEDRTSLPGVLTFRPVEAEGTSSAHGRFRLGPLPDGVWGVRVSHPEHPRQFDFLDTADPDQLVQLAASARLVGRVLAHDGAAAADALVRLHIASESRSTRTAPDGTFAFGTVPQGEAGLLGVHASGNAMQLVEPVEADPAAAGPIEVQLLAAERVAGRIVDVQGAPLAGAQLRIDGPAVLDLGFTTMEPTTLEWFLRANTTRSAEDGSFAFEDLRPGLHVLRAKHPDHSRITLVREVRAGVEDLLLRFDPAGLEQVVLLGQVRDGESGQPVRAFRVTPMAHAAEGGAMGTSDGFDDPQGRFRVAGLEPGRWSSSVAAEGYATWQSNPAELAAGEHAFEVQLGRTRAVQLRLVDQHGEPLPDGARVRFWTLDGRPAAVTLLGSASTTVLSLEDGEALATGLPAQVLRMRLEGVPRAIGPLEFDIDLRSQPVGVLELVVELAPPEESFEVELLLAGAASGADVSAFEGEPDEGTIARLQARKDLWLLDVDARVVTRSADGSEVTHTTLEQDERGRWDVRTLHGENERLMGALPLPAAQLDLPHRSARLQVAAPGYAPREILLTPAKPNGGVPYVLFLRRAP